MAKHMPANDDQDVAKTGRLVAIVIAATMILWIGAQWAGGQAGLHPSYAFLFDLMALAALFWSLVVIWRLWQRRKRGGR